MKIKHKKKAVVKDDAKKILDLRKRIKKLKTQGYIIVYNKSGNYTGFLKRTNKNIIISPNFTLETLEKQILEIEIHIKGVLVPRFDDLFDETI